MHCDFDSVTVARWINLSVPVTAGPPGPPGPPVPTHSGGNNGAASELPLGRKCFVDDRGQRRRARVVRAERTFTVTKITTVCFVIGSRNAHTLQPDAAELQHRAEGLRAAGSVKV